MKYLIYLLLTALLYSASFALNDPKIYRRLTSDSFIVEEVITEEETLTEEYSIRCGVGPKAVTRTTADNRIVNGITAAKNSWPSVVFLQMSSGDICGGSIIDNYHILTAAHCFNQTKPSDITVYLGMHSSDLSDAQETRKISRMIIHKNYDEVTNDYDIAIIKMTKSVEFTPEISPVCLPAYDEYDYENVWATAVGWGLTQEDPKEFPDKLQQVTVKTMSNEVCSGADTLWQPEQITRQMLCATSDLQDSCGGDSGGPLFFKPTGDTSWTQIGIVSYGKTCADGRYPGVYTRVTVFLDWIKKHTSSVWTINDNYDSKVKQAPHYKA